MTPDDPASATHVRVSDPHRLGQVIGGLAIETHQLPQLGLASGELASETVVSVAAVVRRVYLGLSFGSGQRVGGSPISCPIGQV